MGWYRKRPVIIQAVRWMNGELPAELDQAVIDGKIRFTELGTLLIDTLEGCMEARSGDWIIKGIAGEYYPCKHSIFEVTYEAVPAP